MNVHWKFWQHQPRSGSLSGDKLEHIAVGDPDPTSDPGTANGYRLCRFEWTAKASQTLILSWSCTRKLGHHGQHLAGTGEWVAAAHPQLSLTATGYQRLGVIAPFHSQRNGQRVLPEDSLSGGQYPESGQ